MTGEVNADLDAIVRLRVTGPGGTGETFGFVVDTGFSGGLTLPIATIERLGLRLSHETIAILADGGEIRCDVYSAEVDWDGQAILVTVDASGGDRVIGMSLLSGHRITIDAVPDGRVTISPLP